MENYMAEDLPPVERCVGDVAQCDIYILLLANRYGFVPEGGDKSVTEIEYETAKRHGKQILAFLSDDANDFPPDADGDVEGKKQKLAAFKKMVRTERLTHPEPFISPDSLAVQVSESLMKKLFLEFGVVDKRRLCCDRQLQFSDYLQSRCKCRVKVFLVHGQRKELGFNLINRFLYFTLNTGITGDTLPYHRFTDFMRGDYEGSKTSLIVNLLDLDLQVRNIPDPGFAFLLSAVEAHSHPNLVVAFECSTKLLREEEIETLKKFFSAFRDGYEKTGTKEVYFFLNIEDNHEDPNVINNILQSFKNGNGTADPFVFELPRLRKENYKMIEQWISTYITGDQICVDTLMEKYFDSLMQADSVTMFDAEMGLKKLLKKINTRDSEVVDILNF